MTNPDQIARIYDYFLCSHPISPLYSTAAVDYMYQIDLTKQKAINQAITQTK